MSEIPEDIRRAAKNALQSAKNRRHPVASLVPDNLIIDEIEGAILAERVAQMDNAKAAHVSITLANAEIERLNGVVKTLSDELGLAEEEGCDTDDTIRTQSVAIASLGEENRRLREALENIRDGYGPNHLSRFARNIARAALSKAEGTAEQMEAGR